MGQLITCRMTVHFGYVANLYPGSLNLEPGTWNPELGTRNLIALPKQLDKL